MSNHSKKHTNVQKTVSKKHTITMILSSWYYYAIYYSVLKTEVNV